MAKTIYFIRHGECQANADRLIAGARNDSPLTSKGLLQADAVAEKLRDKPIDLIVSSPLIRAAETARRIAEKCGYDGRILVEPLLTERDFGAATDQPLDLGFAAIDAGEVEGIETLEQLAVRMQHALEWLATLPGEHILAVGHAGAERMLRTVYEGKPYHAFFDTPDLHNGHVREYKIG